MKDIWGIGRSYSRLLQANGIRTALELRDADDRWIRREMGVVGVRIVWELRGISCLPLELSPPPKKSLMVSRSFGRPIAILDAVGLELSVESIIRTKRDPQFRTRILTIYGYTCAVCSFDIRLGETSIGVEAAHIKWHQAGGPDCERNGLALCILHHKLFDRGAFTVSDDRHVHVSEYAYGSQGFTEWLLAFHGQSIRLPQDPQYLPKEEYVHWHRHQVFREPARYLGR